MSRAHPRTLACALCAAVALVAPAALHAHDAPHRALVHVTGDAAPPAELARQALTLSARIDAQARHVVPAPTGPTRRVCPANDHACVLDYARQVGADSVINLRITRTGPQRFWVDTCTYTLHAHRGKICWGDPAQGYELGLALDRLLDTLIERIDAHYDPDANLWHDRTYPAAANTLWIGLDLGANLGGRGEADFSALGTPSPFGLPAALTYHAQVYWRWRVLALGASTRLTATTRRLVELDDPSARDPRFDGLTPSAPQGREYLQWDTNLSGLAHISWSELTGNMHLTELQLFAQLEAGYTTLTPPVIDGGIDLHPGANAALSLGLSGLITDALAARGAVTFQGFHVAQSLDHTPNATAHYTGWRVLLTGGMALAPFDL